MLGENYRNYSMMSFFQFFYISNSIKFDYIMRRRIPSKSNRNMPKMYQDISLPMFSSSETELYPIKTSKNINSHMRTRTRQIQSDANSKVQLRTRTPASFLPRIIENSQRKQELEEKNELESLQTYVQKLLLKNLKEYQTNKDIKSLEENLQKRKKGIAERQGESKKQKQSSRLQQLRLKLNQLYGELKVEEKKLQIEYAIEEKMEKKYNGFYDKMSKRFQKNNTVDSGQNTDDAEKAKEQIKPQQTKRKSKLLSKFRVAAYAVYFSIIFPKYSKIYQSLRRKDYEDKILKGNEIMTSVQKCYKLFELMKLKLLWIQTQYKNKDNSEDAIQVNIIQPNEQSQCLSFQFKKQNIDLLLKHVLTHILKAIKDGRVDHLLSIFPYILMNRAYVTDSLLLENQLFDLNMNKSSFTMNLTENQQKSLLVNFILIKLTAFGFMVNNSFFSKAEMKYLFNKQKSNKFENITSTISNQLLICGAYLIKLCNKINKQSVSNEQVPKGNIEEADSERSRLLLPVTMPELEFKSTITFPNNRGMDKRTSIQDSLTSLRAQSSEITVKNMRDVANLLIDFDDYDNQVQITALIQQIRDQAYKKAIHFKKQLYDGYQKSALDELGRSWADEDHLQYVTERNESEKQKIMSYCIRFHDKRQKKQQTPLAVQAKQPSIFEASQQSSQTEQQHSITVSVAEN